MMGMFKALLRIAGFTITTVIVLGLVYIFMPEKARPYLNPTQIVSEIETVGIYELSSWDEILLTYNSIALRDSITISISSGNCNRFCTRPVVKIWRDDTVKVGFVLHDPSIHAAAIVDQPNKLIVLNVQDTIIRLRGQVKMELVQPSEPISSLFPICKCSDLNEVSNINPLNYQTKLDEILFQYEADAILAAKLQVVKNQTQEGYTFQLIPGSKLETDQSWFFHNAEQDASASPSQ